MTQDKGNGPVEGGETHEIKKQLITHQAIFVSQGEDFFHNSMKCFWYDHIENYNANLCICIVW